MEKFPDSPAPKYQMNVTARKKVWPQQAYATPSNLNLLSKGGASAPGGGAPLATRGHPRGARGRVNAHKECGWKDGDRGGLALTRRLKRAEERKTALDTHRPSHGGSWQSNPPSLEP
jgi:hypothetical protein